MLKKMITYTDFNGNQRTDPFYFNLTKAELLEMEVGADGGLAELLKKIVETRDERGLVQEFKKFILLSIGEKSDDGTRFIKNDQIREAFTQTEAYSVLFMELAQDDGAAAVFIKGLMPADLQNEVTMEIKQNELNAQTAAAVSGTSLTPPPLPTA